MKLLNTSRWGVLLLAAVALNASNRDVPFATRVVSMEYPRLAAGARITGTAVLRVGIDSTGKVVIANGLSGHPILVKGAEENIKLWRFSPGRSSGEKAVSEFDFTYVFKLTDGSDTSRPCSALTYEYPDKVTIVSEAPPLNP
jgi:TonB family protein